MTESAEDLPSGPLQYRVMTFQRYAPFFQPGELHALTAAYNAAWQDLLTARTVNATQAHVVEKKLAQVILASACTGERDAARLKEIALRAVLGDKRIK